MKKSLILPILLFLGLFSPLIASAQLDPRCFTKKQCDDVRATLVKEANGSAQEAAGGFVDPNSETELACGKEDYQHNALSFCLPVGQTKTQISFGGKTQFEHLGDFIQYMYRYAIVVAGILATIMVIVAGFEWLTSGGNTERITSARKRIWGAMLGLLFAVSSYLLLTIINPYLVQLRLPQVWLVNSQGLVPAFCSQADDGKKMALANTQTEELTLAQLAEKQPSAVFDPNLNNKTANCGDSYFIEGSGTQTCRGTVCKKTPQGEQTVCLSQPDNPLLYACKKGNIGGMVLNNSFTKDVPIYADWEWPWIDEGETEIHGICNNNTTFELSSEDNTANIGEGSNGKQQFVIGINGDVSALSVAACGSESDVKGFFLVAEINENVDPTDEDHYIGIGGVDLGDKDVFERTKSSISKDKFISLSQLMNGVEVNIDLAAIKDYD